MFHNIVGASFKNGSLPYCELPNNIFVAQTVVPVVAASMVAVELKTNGTR
jgi:hypothetical protein